MHATALTGDGFDYFEGRMGWEGVCPFFDDCFFFFFFLLFSMIVRWVVVVGGECMG